MIKENIVIAIAILLALIITYSLCRAAGEKRPGSSKDELCE